MQAALTDSTGAVKNHALGERIQDDEAWVAAISPDPYSLLHTAISTSRCGLQLVSDLHCAASEDGQPQDHVQQNARVLAKSPSCISIRRKSSAGRLQAQPSAALVPVADATASVLPSCTEATMGSAPLASRTQHTIQLFQPENSKLLTRTSYAKEYFGEAYKEEYDRVIHPCMHHTDSTCSQDTEEATTPDGASSKQQLHGFSSSTITTTTAQESLTQHFCGGELDTMAGSSSQTSTAVAGQQHAALLQARPAPLVVVGTISTLMDSFAAIDTPGPLIRPRQLQVHADNKVPQGGSLSEHNSTYARARAASVSSTSATAAAATATATTATATATTVHAMGGVHHHGTAPVQPVAARHAAAPNALPIHAPKPPTTVTVTGSTSTTRSSTTAKRHVSPAHAGASNRVEAVMLLTSSSGALETRRHAAADVQGSPARPLMPNASPARMARDNAREASTVDATHLPSAHGMQSPQLDGGVQQLTGHLSTVAMQQSFSEGRQPCADVQQQQQQQSTATVLQPRPLHQPAGLNGLKAVLAAVPTSSLRPSVDDVLPVPSRQPALRPTGGATMEVSNKQQQTCSNNGKELVRPLAAHLLCSTPEDVDTESQQAPASVSIDSNSPLAIESTTVDGVKLSNGACSSSLAAASCSQHEEHRNNRLEQPNARSCPVHSCNSSIGRVDDAPSTPPRPRGRPPLPSMSSPSQSTDSITSGGSPARYAASRGAASHSLLRSSRDPSPTAQRPGNHAPCGVQSQPGSCKTSRDPSPQANDARDRGALTMDPPPVPRRQSREFSGSGAVTSSQCLHPSFVPVQALGPLRASNPGWQPYAASPERVLLPTSSSQPGFLPPITSGNQGGSRRDSRDPSPAVAVDLRARRSVCRSRDPSPITSRLEQQHTIDSAAAGSRSGSTIRVRLSTDPGISGTSHTIIPDVPGMRAGLQRAIKHAAHEILDGPAWRPNGVLQHHQHHTDAREIGDFDGVNLPRLLPQVKAATVWVQPGSTFHVLTDEPLPHDAL